MKTQKATFRLERATKNTYLFEEEPNGEPKMIGALYVQKYVFLEGAPQKITITLEG